MAPPPVVRCGLTVWFEQFVDTALVRAAVAGRDQMWRGPGTLHQIPDPLFADPNRRRADES